MVRYIVAKVSFVALFLFGGVCPLCIPKMVIIASFFGITLVPQESIWMTLLFQVAFLVVCILSFRNFRKHKVRLPFVLTALGSVYLVLFSWLFPKVMTFPFWTLYLSFGILAVAAVYDVHLCKKHSVLCTECLPIAPYAPRSEKESPCGPQETQWPE